MQSQQRPPAAPQAQGPRPPKSPIPADDSRCPPGHRPNPARPPAVEKNYYQEPKRLKGKQARGGSESMSKRPAWDPGESRKASLRSEISSLSLHDTDPTFQTVKQPQPKSPAKAAKKSKSLPSLSPKGRQVDYKVATAPRSVDYSYLDKFKPPPVQYQTTREREESQKQLSKLSPQPPSRATRPPRNAGRAGNGWRWSVVAGRGWHDAVISLSLKLVSAAKWRT